MNRKIVSVLIKSDMPLKNGRAISNFNLIEEIKRWINCVSHKFSSLVSIVEIAIVLIPMHGWFSL